MSQRATDLANRFRDASLEFERFVEGLTQQ
jgi:hypothetical protein